MRMQPSDLADVSGAAYTYLMNGRAPAGNWTGLFRAGERVRLRFINGSAMSTFDVRIPGLQMTVVAADGQNVHPMTVDEFRIATAETFDVLVTLTGADAFTIFAQSLDRTGYARGTLAVSEGLRGARARARPHRLSDDGRHGPRRGARAPDAAPASDAADHAARRFARSGPGRRRACSRRRIPRASVRNPGIDMQTTAPEPKLDRSRHWVYATTAGAC